MNQGETDAYYVRDDEGVVRGPYPLDTVVRLARRGASGLQVSTDGRSFVPVWLQKEVRSALDQARGGRVARSEPAPARTEVAVDVAPVLAADGDVGAGGVLGLALRLCAARATGRLWVDAADGRHVVWFRDGVPRVAGELEGPHGLVGFVSKSSGMSEGVSREALTSAVGHGRVAIALAALGLETSEQFLGLLQRHAAGTLSRTLASTRGRYHWNDGEEPPNGALRVGDRWSAVVQAWRALPADEARVRLGEQFDKPIRLAPEALTPLAEVPLTPDERALALRFDGSRSPAELSAESLAVDDHSGRAEKVAFALAESGWGIVDDGRISVLVSGSSNSAVSRAVLGTSKLVDVKREWLSADHFTVLGVPRVADAIAIERGALEIRSRLRLDVTETDPTLAALKRELVDRVELARRTLADPRDRAIYEAMLGP